MSHTILVVDDEADVRKFLTAVLEKHGYRVVAAEDGKRAFEEVENERPDLIVLDLQMPEQTGTDFYRRLLKHDALRDIPDHRCQRPCWAASRSEQSIRGL